jgi:hypothetical protein
MGENMTALRNKQVIRIIIDDMERAIETHVQPE